VPEGLLRVAWCPEGTRARERDKGLVELPDRLEDLDAVQLVARELRSFWHAGTRAEASSIYGFALAFAAGLFLPFDA